MDKQQIIATTRTFVLREFLPGEDPDNLTINTPLISSGVLDSISRLKLVTFLENSYSVEFEAHEMGVEYLETLSDIADTVLEKKERAA